MKSTILQQRISKTVITPECPVPGFRCRAEFEERNFNRESRTRCLDSPPGLGDPQRRAGRLRRACTPKCGVSARRRAGMTVILVRRFVRRLLDILLKTPRRWCQAFRPDTIAGFFPVRRKLLTANTCFSSKLLATLIVVLSSTAIAQDRDSARVSIHQSEAEMHRWDNMKVHPSVPQLQRGAELARKGDVIGAVRAFQKAAPARPSMAYFNLGIVYFETGRLEQAIRYFRLSYRARRDSVCLDYLQNTERLINEHKLRR